MQFEQVDEATRIDLPRPSIDTGMGLESITAILQGVTSNYDIDLFRTLIAAIQEHVGRPSGAANEASPRVIADHLRATSFLIADGVLPSNEGRGYVLRRIMRRAMRHAHMLGASEPAIFRLVPTLVHEMGQAYPELVRAQGLVTETLRLEEERFRKTLSRGLALLEDAVGGLGKGDTLDGETAFKLYDTYGFPLDLTQDALKPRGIGVDLAGFTDAMERQRAEARASWAGSGEAATEGVWLMLRDRLGATEFLGYDTESAEGQVLALVKDGAEADSLGEGEGGAIVVNQTPFYGEAGGQVGDTGLIESDNGALFHVTDTQRRADGLFVHTGAVERGGFVPGQAVKLSVDSARRAAIRKNHSATHLLHAALRRTLGTHVAQKGSLVAPDRLRFDFAHPKPLSAAESDAVEELANDIVLQDAPVQTRLMDREAAMASGAMALFGEKYGEEVRVVSMGRPTNGGGEGPYSVELCGGTHVGRTGEIGLVTLVSEGAVAAGVRRIEALTGAAARRHLAAQEKRLGEIAAALKVRPEAAAERVAALVDERRRLERELAEAKKKLAMGGGAEADQPQEVNGVRLLARKVDLDVKAIKPLIDAGKKQIGSGVVAYATRSPEGKAALVVGVTPDLVASNNAVELVRAGVEKLGGKGGGGRPDLAQGGGPNGAALDMALEAVKQAIRSPKEIAAA
jgi:alanyl-tRNA synthetase